MVGQSASEARARLIAENNLPTVPTDWAVERFRFVFSESKERNGVEPIGTMLSVSEYSGVVTKEYSHEEQRRTDEELQTYRVVRPGQLAVNTMWLNHLGLGVSNHLGHVSPAYAVYNISKRLDRQFAHHLLRSNYYLEIYKRYLYGIRPNSFQIKSSDWLSIPILIPPIEQQRTISDFLDRETARIDQLIEKKVRLVEMLGDKRAALIEQAIVQDGQKTRLGHHVDILSGYAFPSAEFSNDPEDVPLLRGVNIAPGRVRWDEVVYWPRGRAAQVSPFALNQGDVVLGMDRPWISSGIRVAELTERDTPSLLLQRVCRITPRRSLDKGFMKLLLSSRRFLGHFEPILTGVSVPHISPDQVGAFRFNYINVDRQKMVAEAVERADTSIKKVIEAVEVSIDRLREFRATLITASVTGQIDVASWGKRGHRDSHLDAIRREMAS